LRLPKIFLWTCVLISVFCSMAFAEKDADAEAAGESIPTWLHIEADGQWYDYNTELYTILFIGLDSKGPLESNSIYNAAPKADTLILFILDSSGGTIQVLNLSRDIMTSVNAYTVDGYMRGPITTHLGYAFSFGDGGKVSCANTVEAVSTLLCGIPIDDYVVLNKDSIVKGNEMVGGVTVTVPNNDLASYYEGMTKGSVIKLNSKNVYRFIWYRVKNQPFSNNGRMERQIAFCKGFLRLFRQQLVQSPANLWNRVQEFKDYMYTSVSNMQFLILAAKYSSLSFEDISVIQMGTEDVEGDLYDEVWIPQEEILKTVLSVFYKAA